MPTASRDKTDEDLKTLERVVVCATVACLGLLLVAHYFGIVGVILAVVAGGVLARL